MLGAPTRAAAVGTTGTITGAVTDAITHSPITSGKIDVIAFGPQESEEPDFKDAYTNSSGVYSISGLAAGTYMVWFLDDNNDYLDQFYNGQPSPDTANDVVVTAGTTTPNINAALARASHITGTVTDATSHAPVGEDVIDVAAYQSDGVGGWNYVNDAGTNSDGTYDVLVAAGTYRVEFDDESGTYVTQYYDDKPTIDDANDVVVGSEDTTSGIDAAMARSTTWSVYRFRNLRNGYYLWTASAAERDNILDTMWDTWTLEGVAYRINTLTNTSPLWRFRNLKKGFYLYTSDPNEKNSIVAKLSKSYKLEGVAYSVSRTTGSPVWRFQNLKDGTYLYSADPNEKANIVAKLSKTWKLEGVAYLIAP